MAGIQQRQAERLETERDKAREERQAGRLAERLLVTVRIALQVRGPTMQRWMVVMRQTRERLGMADIRGNFYNADRTFNSVKYASKRQPMPS